MLTAKLVRLETAWSATPQLRRRPAWRTSRHGTAVRRFAPLAACPRRVASKSILTTATPGLSRTRVTASASPLRGLGARCLGVPARRPPQHVVEQASGQQLANPPQPDEP